MTGDEPSRTVAGDTVDFAYLAAQTFGDTDLEAELLDLFVAQGREAIPRFPLLTPAARFDLAHRLKGAARAIGATRVALSLEAYECADVTRTGAEDPAYRDFVASFEATITAITAHLDKMA